MRARLYRFVFLTFLATFLDAAVPAADLVYGKGFRQDRGGWLFVHIEGGPIRRGEQYGYLTAPEIGECVETLKAYMPNIHKKDWAACRAVSETLFLPKVPKELRQEMEGIAKGMIKRGQTGYDFLDVVTMNCFCDLESYFDFSSGNKVKSRFSDGRVDPLSRCSAFIATGSMTKDGKIVLAHNTWCDYILTQRGNVILDIKPSRGARVLMQCSYPGLVSSGSDFGLNSRGLVVSETTIAYAQGFDTAGVPEFVRMRMAIQYARDIDGFYELIRRNNNGAYANAWLIGDIKTNEIAKIELGLKNVAFYRSQDGFYDGENYVDDSKMIREECGPSLWDTQGFWPNDLLCGNSVSARRCRWYQLFDQGKGAVDAEAAKAYLADQVDPLTGLVSPGGQTIMRRVEINTVGGGGHVRPFGAGDGKVITADLAAAMSFWARLDHPDGSPFSWGQFLIDNPEYAWQRPFLRDLEDRPWTLFRSAGKR